MGIGGWGLGIGNSRAGAYAPAHFLGVSKVSEWSNYIMDLFELTMFTTLTVLIGVPYWGMRGLAHFVSNGFKLHLSTLLILTMVASILVFLSVTKLPNPLSLFSGEQYGIPFPFCHDDNFSPLGKPLFRSNPFFITVDALYYLGTLFAVAGYLERRIYRRNEAKRIQEHVEMMRNRKP